MEKSRYLLEETYLECRKPTEEAKTITPLAYTCEEFFRFEKQQVFDRNWLVAGPLNLVEKTGDILVADISGQSIIITRDEDGELRAYYNVCRHRGTRLCQNNGSVKKHIICPYHGWAYNLRGQCVGTPLFDKGENRKVIAMHDMSHLRDFDKENFSLFPARVSQWGGFIFVCLDEETPPLEECFGDLSHLLNNYQLHEWELLGARTYEVNCNWKLLIENGIEYYHLPWVHPRLAKTSRMIDHHRWQGKGMYCGVCTSPITSTDDSGWLSMKNFNQLNDKERISGYFFGVFPNMLYFLMPSHAFVLQLLPVSPVLTIENAWLLSHPMSYADTSQADIDSVMDFWNEVNMEDVGICQKLQLGLSAKPYTGGRMCYHFEEPVHRFQNMIIDAMVGLRTIPSGDGDIV